MSSCEIPVLFWVIGIVPVMVAEGTYIFLESPVLKYSTLGKSVRYSQSEQIRRRLHWKDSLLLTVPGKRGPHWEELRLVRGRRKRGRAWQEAFLWFLRERTGQAGQTGDTGWCEWCQWALGDGGFSCLSGIWRWDDEGRCIVAWSMKAWKASGLEALGWLVCIWKALQWVVVVRETGQGSWGILWNRPEQGMSLLYLPEGQMVKHKVYWSWRCGEYKP